MSNLRQDVGFRMSDVAWATSEIPTSRRSDAGWTNKHTRGWYPSNGFATRLPWLTVDVLRRIHLLPTMKTDVPLPSAEIPVGRPAILQQIVLPGPYPDQPCLNLRKPAQRRTQNAEGNPDLPTTTLRNPEVAAPRLISVNVGLPRDRVSSFGTLAAVKGHLSGGEKGC